jgi:dihydrofolate synthase / folylpolyglutamate synthase
VAGTNGKGSVCLKIATTLQNYGLKVGLFCSPHVASFRERMQVNGEFITEAEVVELLPHIYDLCDRHSIPATFFEITTALAFSYYAKQQVQVVVLETGLGGRLDATNVISKPAISIITSIGLEHTKILGDTIELIAMEKGGIIKPNCPVLVGPYCPHDVLRQCAQEKQSGPYYTPSDVLLSLKGATSVPQDLGTDDYDKENQQIAKAALILLQESLAPWMDPSKPLTDEVIDIGTSVRPPCRFEQVQEDGLTVILDVAHNPPAMEYLVRKLKVTYPTGAFRFVLGMSSDKDLGHCGRSILALTQPSAIHLVEAAHPRAAKLEAMREADARLLQCHCDLDDRSITKQIGQAKRLAKEAGEILVVCGSVFLMAEAREALGFDEPRDSKYVAAASGAEFRHGQEQFGNTTTTPLANK